MHAVVTEEPAGASSRSMRDLRPTELPAPPAVAMRLLRACSDEDSDVAELAGLASADPALAAELLRITNSAFFGYSGSVASVAQAVSILGYRSLRHYVLCIAVRDTLGKDVVHGADLTGFWRASLARAVAARAIGEAVGVDGDECFTVGLLLDIGLAAQFHAQPERVGHWEAVLGADPDERIGLERDLFGTTHDHAGAALVEGWGLPGRLAVAIGAHHVVAANAGDDESSTGLAGIARAADWLAAVHREGARREDVARARSIVAATTRLDAERIDSLLASLPDAVSRAAEALGFEIAGDAPPEEILQAANLALVEENIGAQELNWRLQRALDERDALDARRRTELESARTVQRGLLPAVAPDSAFSGINAPARELSGDFYDHFPLADGRSFFCLADVSGKGMDAGLLMARTSGLFHCLAKLVHDPAKLLGLVNNELAQATVRGMFVTTVAGVLDPEQGTVGLVNAGHLPALLLDSRGNVEVVAAQSPPLGIVPGQAYETQLCQIAGRTLYLFSDGLVEAPDGRGGHLGYAGLVDVLRGLSSTPRLERPARILTTVGRTHDLDTDDVTILVVEGAEA